MQEAGRQLSLYIGRKRKGEIAKKKKELFKNYAVELATSLSDLSGKEREQLLKQIIKLAEKMYESGQIEEK